MDFTHKTYRKLLQTLLEQGFSFQPFEDYLTDTGRRWDGDRVSVRDKTTQTYEITARRGEKFFAPTRCRSTRHIIAAARQNRLPNQIMLTIHPQRWTNKPLPWLQYRRCMQRLCCGRM